MSTNVVMGSNIKKTSDRLDVQGNIINPRTKQIIQANDPGYIPTPEEIARTINTVTLPQSPTSSASVDAGSLSILDQIKQAEENLKSLKELKKLKIAEKKAELELLQQ